MFDIALTNSVTQNIRGVTERHCLWKEILSQERISGTALTEYIFRLRIRHHPALIQIESVKERLLKAAQRMPGSCMQLLEQCSRTTIQRVTPHLPATMSHP